MRSSLTVLAVLVLASVSVYYRNIDEQASSGDNSSGNVNYKTLVVNDAKSSASGDRYWSSISNDFVDDAIIVEPILLTSASSRSRRSADESKREFALMEDYYLYQLNVFGDDVLLNLSRLNSDEMVLAPNFIVQHFDTNYTYVENGIDYDADRCLYTGQIVGNSSGASGRWSTLLNLCKGMYGVLELPQGTYFLEPFANDTSRQDEPTKQHLLYKHQSHTFHDYQSSLFHPGENHSSNQRKNFSSNFRSSRNERVQFAHSGHQRHRRSYSWNYYVEVLVVADARLRRYHDRNLENYVVTLLSIVASIYKHPSLKAALNIVIAGPKITENAQDTLRQFCRWQQSVNDENDESVNHHDVAILLTRQDICRSMGKCDTLGLAELGTMCDPFRSCAIIEDNGLSAAFTIAHELGHIFNIPHDDEKKCSQYMKLDKENFHIMAPTLEYNTHPWSWSPCSWNMLKQFLENHNTDCLVDMPVQQRYKDSLIANPAPGKNFGVDQQCQFVFGPSASLCPYMPACKRLWCATAHGYQVGCRTQHMPWADGTPCGYSRWCYRGECVGMAPDQLVAVDGVWGQWKEWGECSRSCGGGVKRATRDCDNPEPSNGGKYCVGERVRFRSCHTRECPHDTPEFRDVQCSEFNNDNRNIHGVPSNVRWVPQYSGISPTDQCKLYCTVESRSDFYLMKHRVVDGTPCGRDSDNICVDGQCKSAGCDGELGSSLKRDACGICGGDGTKCRKIYGVFNEPTTYGYNSVLKIQAGVNNIDIRQRAWNSRKDDDNYLALSNSQGEFILNGQFQVSVFHREVRVRGTVLEYSGSDSVIERINSSKPIMEDLYLHVLAVGQLRPADISWEFLVLDDPHAVSHRQEYSWRLNDQWSECNRPCHGSQTRRAICVSNSDSQAKDERHCDNLRKPVMEQRVCNLHCQLKWLTEASSECNVRCGAGEMGQRSMCVKTSMNGENQRLDDAFCRDIDRPPERVPCFRDCAGRQWTYSGWDLCSKTCNGGIQRRAARCVDESGSALDNRYCENLITETTEQSCNTMQCPTWQYGEWFKCSATCGGGVQLRHASCVDAAGRDIDSSFCNNEEKQDRRKCNEAVCAKWKFGGWSDCSQTCGSGVSYREARCVDSHDQVLNEQFCVASQKIVSKQCLLDSCPQWVLGEWSQCSRTCLDGWSSRRVSCVNSRNDVVDSKHCGTVNETPPSHKPCNHGPCPFWRSQSWTECSVTCGSGQKTRVVECVYKDEVVDSGYCRDMEQPPRFQVCTLIACPDWQFGQWDSCSVSCGDGYQHREVRCIYPESRHTAEPELCNHERKPKAVKECKKSSCPIPTTLPPTTLPTTSTKTSTPLTTTARRSSSTRRKPTATSAAISLSSLVTFKPKIMSTAVTARSTTNAQVARSFNEDNSVASPSRYTAQQRNSHSQQSEQYNNQGKDVSSNSVQTSPTKWEMGAWAGCSASCGTGERMRYVACRDVFSRILPDIYCGHETKPHDREHCQNAACAQWTVGPWTQCTATCGESHKRRRHVACEGNEPKALLDWSFCNSSKQPATEEDCQLPACVVRQSPNEITQSLYSHSSWRVGDWSQCSTTCGVGYQERLVICLSPTSMVMPSVYMIHCAESTKPEAFQICIDQPCGDWSVGDWSECNKSCGGGVQRRLVECVQVDNGHVLPTQNCPNPPPNPSQACNVQRCQRLIWRTGKWSSCSASCGRGIRTRSVECYSEANRVTVENEAECSSIGESKPEAYHRCRMAKCPKWIREKWSPCSVSCGEGVRTRNVFCAQGRRHTVADQKCLDLPKPQLSARCMMPSCPFYRWETTSWTKCSNECGYGNQTRFVSCVNNYGQRAPPGQCNSLKRPPNIQNCTGQPCPYTWMPGSWSTCSRSCGDGEQYRSMHCQMKNEISTSSSNHAVTDNAGGPQVPAYHCSGLPKPAAMRHCSLGSCGADAFWQTDLWSACSVSCGWGIQERQIYCVHKNNTRLDRLMCNYDARPRRRRRCFLRNCEASDCNEVRELLNTTVDGTYNILVSGHMAKVFCYGMNGTLPKEYFTLPSGSATNYAEFYGKRLLFPFTCPYNGYRNDSCSCTEEGNPQPGMTRFKKVRVDLHNMKINIMDTHFAYAESGELIPFATAGDCYSAVDCPQGRFSIDFRGTGFRISGKNVWQEDGHRTSKHIVRLEEGVVIQGSCGGYCGKCFPDKRHGLSFEIDPWQFNEVQVVH